MQKLVKKTRHYQTLVPVEAYEGEGGYFSQEKIDDYLLLGSCGFAVYSAATGFTPGAVVGLAFCAAGAANTDTGREVIATGIETYGERQMEVGLAELEGNQELGNRIGDALSDANDAFGDAVIDWVGSIDQDDPMVQLYGE